MKYDIVEDDIKIGNKIIYGIDKDILDIIHSLEKENQELKADYGSKVQVERDMLQQENEELKKQLEKKYSKTGTLTNEVLYEENIKLINQQKEFINYLEDKIKSYKNRDSYMVADILGSYDLNNIELELLEEILSKYKEIIGE